MTIEEQFLPQELSFELARLGFNYPCLAKFKDNGELVLLSKPTINIETFPICAPLWQQAFEWLSEKYGLDVLIHNYDENRLFISINNNYVVDNIDFKKTFRKSEVKSEAIKICLKHIQYL